MLTVEVALDGRLDQIVYEVGASVDTVIILLQLQFPSVSDHCLQHVHQKVQDWCVLSKIKANQPFFCGQVVRCLQNSDSNCSITKQAAVRLNEYDENDFQWVRVSVPYMENRSNTPPMTLNRTLILSDHFFDVGKGFRGKDNRYCNGFTVRIACNMLPVLPLVAITVASLQSRTISVPIVMDNSLIGGENDEKGKGMIYTVCSRVTDKKLIYLLYPPTKYELRVHNSALSFLQYHKTMKAVDYLFDEDIMVPRNTPCDFDVDYEEEETTRFQETVPSVSLHSEKFASMKNKKKKNYLPEMMYSQRDKSATVKKFREAGLPVADGNGFVSNGYHTKACSQLTQEENDALPLYMSGSLSAMIVDEDGLVNQSRKPAARKLAYKPMENNGVSDLYDNFEEEETMVFQDNVSSILLSSEKIDPMNKKRKTNYLQEMIKDDDEDDYLLIHHNDEHISNERKIVVTEEVESVDFWPKATTSNIDTLAADNMIMGSLNQDSSSRGDEERFYVANWIRNYGFQYHSKLGGEIPKEETENAILEFMDGEHWRRLLQRDDSSLRDLLNDMINFDRKWGKSHEVRRKQIEERMEIRKNQGEKEDANVSLHSRELIRETFRKRVKWTSSERTWIMNYLRNNHSEELRTGTACLDAIVKEALNSPVTQRIFHQNHIDKDKLNRIIGELRHNGIHK